MESNTDRRRNSKKKVSSQKGDLIEKFKIQIFLLVSIWLLDLSIHDISVIRCHSDDKLDFDDSLYYSFSNFAKYQSLGHMSLYHMQFKLIFPIIPLVPVTPRARTKVAVSSLRPSETPPKMTPKNKIPNPYPTTTTSHQGSFKSKIHFSGRRGNTI